MPIAAVVLAGGRGSRIRAEVNKVYLPIGGRDMLVSSLQAFDRASDVDRIVVVARPDDVGHLESIAALTSLSTPVTVAMGGATRHQSERSGIEALAPAIEAGDVELVAVHDGARPFITVDLLDRVVEAARRHGGAVPALPVEGDLYRREGVRARHLGDAILRRAQTPQVFWSRHLLEGYRRAAAEGFEGVDTAETAQRFTDLDVALVEGDRRNLKVTFVEDLLVAEDLARTWTPEGWREGA
jgi:2-C-methyl-D-erythritol 4-phosphate cytidylyltransferase